MSRIDYLPTSDADRVSWINNFAIKIVLYQTTLGLAAADITQAAKDSTMYAYIVNLLNIFKQMQQNATSYKNMLKHVTGSTLIGPLPAMPTLPAAPPAVAGGIFDRTRLLVQRIKNSAGYTEAIGQDLNIIAPVNSVDLTTITPVLKGTLDVGRPHLKWQKGLADAVDLYADHDDGAGFVYIGRFLRSEYLDVTPMAAGKIANDYKYKAIFVIADEQVGVMSQVVTVRALRQ